MNFLFLHHSFPAQFRYTAAALAGRKGNRVLSLSEEQRRDLSLPDVESHIVPVTPPQNPASQAEYESLRILRRGQAFADAMLRLREQGFTPDVVIDHCAFGCGLFVKDVFPQTRRVSYCEWYFNKRSPYDLRGVDPARASAAFAPQRVINQCQLDALAECDAAISPTEWQKSQYPPEFQSKIQVLHDGFDTSFFAPAAPGEPLLQEMQGSGLFGVKELLTYVTRGFEPTRGFPQFFRSLPAVLKARPDCHVVIVGADRTVYDAPRPDKRGWLEVLREETRLDESRVHILGFQPYPRMKRLLQSSSLHVYLTAPYMLSWSPLEALSCGCLLLGSDTEPVREIVRHGVNGFLTPFSDVPALSAAIVSLLEKRDQLDAVRLAARQSVLDNYSATHLLPGHLRLIHGE